MQTPELSIVVPAYNEKDAIVPTMEAILDVFENAGVRVEIIVVNDGSSDGTGDRLRKYLAGSVRATEKIRLIEHERNKGYGASLKTGIRSASAALIAITDADGTYPNERLPEMLAKLRTDDFDMVVGRRPFRKLPLLTKPAKWAITSLANFLTGENIKDINSGLRIFRKEIAERFFGIISDGFSFTTTITLSMMTNGYRVHYFDIDYLKREGKSKIRPIKDTLNFIQLIIRTVMYFDPLKVFVPLSLLLFIAGAALLIGGMFMGKMFDISFVILSAAAFQMLGIGMIADLIVKTKKGI